MSCLDSVFVKCPKCGVEIEFQLKAGKCEMRSYFSNSVPIKIAVDLDGDEETCYRCKSKVHLQAVGVPSRVMMVPEIEVAEDEED